VGCGGSLLANLRTVNPGSDLAAAVNSRISTGLPLGQDGTEELPGGRRLCAAGRGGKSSGCKTLPRNAGATEPVQPQPATASRAPRSKHSCAQRPGLRMFIVHIGLLLSSCSLKHWASRSCLSYRKVKFQTEEWQALPLERAPGSHRNRSGERHCRGRHQGSHVHLPSGAKG